MAWTAPATAVANSVLTAAFWNQQVRDNLLESAPAKATASGRLLVSAGVNSVTERFPTTSLVTTIETTSSTSYTALATGGPAVTVTTGVRALVIVSAHVENSNTGANAYASHAISGATTVASSDNYAVKHRGTAGDAVMASYAEFHIGLTAGTNTFTMEYRVSAGTGTFAFRRIIVIPF